MSGDSKNQFTQHARAVAIMFYGEPNKSLSSAEELRFGNKGSISVDLKKGTYFDHSSNEGGGVLSMVEANTGRKGPEAVDWLRENGFHVEGNQQQRSGASNQDARPADEFKPVKIWDYNDADGKLLFQVVRLENGRIGKDGKPEKTYRQRKPDASERGGWKWSTKDVKQVPYRLDKVATALRNKRVIFITEGEKAADKLLELGATATTNARGAGSWVPELSDYFKGASVVILPDNDPQATNKDGSLKFHADGLPVFVGKDHANAVATSLQGIAKDIRILELPGIPLKGDVVEWIDQCGGTIEQLYKLAKSAPYFTRDDFKSRFNAIPWSRMDEQAPEHEEVIKGVLARGGISVVSGASQSGKTFLIIDAAMAVARGVEWMGRRVKKGLVVYETGEGQKGLRKRIKGYRQTYDLDAGDDIPFVFMPAKIDLYNSDEGMNAFIDEVKHWSLYYGLPCELIVLDTWSKATIGANENDGKDVALILNRIEKIAEATGAHVLCVHHMNADGTKVRGHTSLLANMDNVLIVKPCEGLSDGDNRLIREAEIFKNKDGETGARIRFVLAQVDIGTDQYGDRVTTCIIRKPNGDGAAAGASLSLNDKQEMLLRALEKALEEHGEFAPAGQSVPQGTRVVDWKFLRATYDSMVFDDVPDDEDGDDRKRRLDNRLKQIGNLGTKLMRLGLIGRDSPYVWMLPKGANRNQKRRASPPPQSDPTPASPVPSHILDEASELLGMDY